MVIRVTKDDDVLNPETRKRIVRQVLSCLRELPKRKRLLVRASLPCTYGTPWVHVNKTIPSAAVKVEEREFRKLWNALVDLVNSLRSASPFVAIEWPMHDRCGTCAWCSHEEAVEDKNEFRAVDQVVYQSR